MKKWTEPQRAPLRGAVVGVGYLGTFHAQKYLKNENIQMMGVCDFNKAQAEKVAHQLGTKVWANPQSLLGHVDMVTIAASTQSHYELCETFLNAGVAVNVEKPLAARLDQAEALVNLADSKKVPLAVGHIERFNPAIVELKRLISKLGSIKIIDLQRMGPFRTRGSDVNVLYDLAIHDVDLLYWLTDGQDVTHFLAQGTSMVSKELDTAKISIEMSHKILANISVSRVHPHVSRSIRVVGTLGTMVANTAAGTLELIQKNPHPKDEGDFLRVTTETVEKADALQAETDAFVSCLLRGVPMAVSGHDGLKAMRLIADIEKQISK